MSNPNNQPSETDLVSMTAFEVFEHFHKLSNNRQYHCVGTPVPSLEFMETAAYVDYGRHVHWRPQFTVEHSEMPDDLKYIVIPVNENGNIVLVGNKNSKFGGLPSVEYSCNKLIKNMVGIKIDHTNVTKDFIIALLGGADKSFFEKLIAIQTGYFPKNSRVLSREAA